METIHGYIDHIIFHNPDNGYTVLNFICEGEEITCVGNLGQVTPGENLRLDGEFVSHPSYGEQFKIESFQETAPESAEAIERYLGSGAVKGIGSALAARIVKKFKTDALRIMEEEPERLTEIKGISERKAMEIAEQLTERKDLRQVILFLQQYGIALTLATKIFQAYGNETYSILKTNPYRLSDDIRGIGFKTADEIASKVGIRADSDFRVRSGIIYILTQATSEGHTCLPKEELLQRAVELLHVEPDLVDKSAMDLAIERKIVFHESENTVFVYLASFYHMELHVASMLKKLDIRYPVPDELLADRISRIEKETGIMLAPEQAEAVRSAARNGLFILTGGPGTGKTTTINAIIRYFEAEGLDLFLAAPTGRAAKRMSEMTGFEARTIHRLLEVNGGVSEDNPVSYFERNELNPLETDAIIIDEVSMVDLPLMHALLKAILAGTRLILVGDVHQLPSVGPGAVLKDLISSRDFHVVSLKHIFRQAAQSDIILNAHAINEGTAVIPDNKSKDFFFLKRYEADKIINVTLQLIQQKLPSYVEADPYEIQVLTPMRKGLLGSVRLNAVLQSYLNPESNEKKEIPHGDGVLREGDKVMQTKNNYQLAWEIRSRYNLVAESGEGVFNGDLGTILEINAFSETVTVAFDEGKLVSYPNKLLDDLELAYAMTIHKSQGSEYPAVIIPLMAGPKLLYNRNLLYTAVTRAKKCVVLVGDEHVFCDMIDNTTEQKRYSGLCERIKELTASSSSLQIP
ncbi:MAG: ATP-dependent RecD-like DNA helicase [Lachnospiraceae bacterium]|nr:ATP-dependent RecD-like DNA helicase [Lachnospiraceae bacterium]